MMCTQPSQMPTTMWSKPLTASWEFQPSVWLWTRQTWGTLNRVAERSTWPMLPWRSMQSWWALIASWSGRFQNGPGGPTSCLVRTSMTRMSHRMTQMEVQDVLTPLHKLSTVLCKTNKRLQRCWKLKRCRGGFKCHCPAFVLFKGTCRRGFAHGVMMCAGADVTHSRSFLKTEPSVAAVVASMDPNATTYACEVKMQGHRQEMIQVCTVTMYLGCSMFKIFGYTCQFSPFVLTSALIRAHVPRVLRDVYRLEDMLIRRS